MLAENFLFSNQILCINIFIDKSVNDTMSRNKIENEIAKKQSKDGILNSALLLISLNGYDAVSFDMIAKQAKCSRPLVYHYFNDKETLYKEMMKNVAFKIFSITEKVNYKNSPDVAMEELLGKIIDAIETSDTKSLDTNYACMFYLILNLHLQQGVVPKPKVESKDRPLEHKKLYDIFYYLIDNGQKQKLFYEGDPRRYVITLLATLKGLSFTKISLEEKFISPDAKMLMHILRKEERK